MSAQDKFLEWQYETVSTKNYGNVSIKYLLNNFLYNNLFPFILKNGYNFDISHNQLANIITTMLYKLDYNRFYLHPLPTNNTFNNEHFHHFEHIINWYDFWASWNNQTNNFFDGAEIHIIHTVWSYIQLETSNAYIEYIDSFETSDNENDLPKKLKELDPYLLDQLNASNHYKFTRFDNA